MSFVPTNHTNPGFNEILGIIGAQVTDMANLCEIALATVCQALETNDRELARSIYQRDGAINDLEVQISMSVATALARHNPVAHDLRALMGSVKMAQEFERLADHAKNIGRRIAWLAKYKSKVAFEDDIHQLGAYTHAMLKEFLLAEAANDTDRAVEVWRRDKRVNDTYMRVMERALSGEAKDEPRVLINSVFIAKNFERIGDKIKNLAEIANFQKTGVNADFDDYFDDEEDDKDRT